MSEPCVRIIPEIDLSSRCFLHIFASSFQSFGFMSSDSFMNGDSRIGLQISFSSGAISNIVSLSVGIAPPDLGSSLAEIVPPVMTIATFGNCRSLRLSVASLVGRFACRSLRWWGWIISADSISDSRIPMLYPDFSFRRIISGSWDSSA